MPNTTVKKITLQSQNFTKYQFYLLCNPLAISLLLLFVFDTNGIARVNSSPPNLLRCDSSLISSDLNLFATANTVYLLLYGQMDHYLVKSYLRSHIKIVMSMVSIFWNFNKFSITSYSVFYLEVLLEYHALTYNLSYHKHISLMSYHLLSQFPQ